LFDRPTGVAVYRGRLFVGDRTRACIHVFDERTGVLIHTIGRSTQLLSVHGLVVDSTKGWLYVCDAEQRLVVVFRAGGHLPELPETFTSSSSPSSSSASASTSPVLPYTPVELDSAFAYQGVLFQSNVAESLGEMKPIGVTVCCHTQANMEHDDASKTGDSNAQASTLICVSDASRHQVLLWSWP
jgi:hypothetical protein